MIQARCETEKGELSQSPLTVATDIVYVNMASGIDPNIWALMSYVPPRGPCNHKEGLISSRCSCQRFMIHPVKAATSYDCDGCSHHASFHSLENKLEEEILKRWKTEAAVGQSIEAMSTAARPKKRARAAIQAGPSNVVVNLETDTEADATERQASWVGSNGRQAR